MKPYKNYRRLALLIFLLSLSVALASCSKTSVNTETNQPTAYVLVVNTVEGGNDTLSNNFTIQDDMSTPPANQAEVQFINLSTVITPGIDISIPNSSALVTT